MTDTKARDRRRAGTTKDYETADLGNGMVQAAREEVLKALSTMPNLDDWSIVRPMLVPMLPRQRPMPTEATSPLTMEAIGTTIGFGMDIGPANLVVAEALFATWNVTLSDVVTAANEHVLKLLEDVTQPELVEQEVDGTKVRILQSGTGHASALLLQPVRFAEIFGKDPGWVVAPMRDLLMWVSPEAPSEFAMWMSAELAAMDPNGLELALWWWDGTQFILTTPGENRA